MFRTTLRHAEEGAVILPFSLRALSESQEVRILVPMLSTN